MVSLQPFIKQNFAATNRIRSSKVITPYRHKLRIKFYLSCLELANTWRGASEIVAKFFFNSNTNVNLFSGTQTWFTNFCACVTWRIDDETIVRYKLWQNVGEILYVPFYGGQTIPNEFQIEIWNTNVPITYVGGESFDLSTLVNPICPLSVSSLGSFIPCIFDIQYIRNEDNSIVFNTDGKPLIYVP